MYNHEPKDYQCPFCSLVKGTDTPYNKQQDIVYKDDMVTVFVSPKWWINNPGNVLVIPNEHDENIYDIPEEVLTRIYLVVKKMSLAIREIYGCTGTSTRQHNEPDGGQDVWHFHVHVFPRYKDDNLYENHSNKRFIQQEEKNIYILKLKEYLSR